VIRSLGGIALERIEQLWVFDLLSKQLLAMRSGRQGIAVVVGYSG
jgi:hypothetical protein